MRAGLAHLSWAAMKLPALRLVRVNQCSSSQPDRMLCNATTQGYSETERGRSSDRGPTPIRNLCASQCTPRGIQANAAAMVRAPKPIDSGARRLSHQRGASDSSRASMPRAISKLAPSMTKRASIGNHPKSSEVRPAVAIRLGTTAAIHAQASPPLRSAAGAAAAIPHHVPPRKVKISAA